MQQAYLPFYFSKRISFLYNQVAQLLFRKTQYCCLPFFSFSAKGWTLCNNLLPTKSQNVPIDRYLFFNFFLFIKVKKGEYFYVSFIHKVSKWNHDVEWKSSGCFITGSWTDGILCSFMIQPINVHLIFFNFIIIIIIIIIIIFALKISK